MQRNDDSKSQTKSLYFNLLNPIWNSDNKSKHWQIENMSQNYDINSKSQNDMILILLILF